MRRALPLGFVLACGGGAAMSVDSTPDSGVVRVDAGANESDAAPEAGAAPAVLEEGELLPGGATTTTRTDVGAFVQQAANLTLQRRNQFEAGLQFVQLVWEEAPGRPEADGLGPTFNTTSCGGCHTRNGRSADLDVGILIRLGPDPAYGDQLQPTGISGVPGEGRVVRTDETVEHVLEDGTVRTLHRPHFELADLAFGPLASTSKLSPRLTPQLVGQGLLEAIPEDDLRALADPDDANGDGISGRLAGGRFGWKASQPSVHDQTAAAFAGDLGITSPLFPDANCPAPQTECTAAPSGGAPELNEQRLTTAAAYVRLLGVPPRRGGEAMLEGKALFGAFGCASCHHPRFVTGTSVEPELAAQIIWPYSDLLLHDLGDDLADDRPDGDATGHEWRTPPLWSIGLLETVTGSVALLHDGRARNVDEAILWHGGEATAARLAYERALASERAALVRFVDSL